MIDAHAHLAAAEFSADLDAVVARARDAGVRGVIAVAETLDDARRNLELTARFPRFVYPAAGLYPTHLDRGKAEEMEAFIRAERERLVAIGEVGLDYWKIQDEDQREVQREILRGFVRLSNELDLPLNIHSRSAGRHVVDLLSDQGARKVLLHAFDAKASTALGAVEAGYFFSIPPSVVRSPQKQKLVARLPCSCLLVESDSPVLGPVPTERNEPANVAVALKAIAQIKGMDPEEVAETLAENTRRLFGALLERQ
jgi:TatD DNase family protein